MPSLKVALCHATGGGTYQAISVNLEEEPAHRAHGDGRIGEPVPAAPLMRFDQDCRPSGGPTPGGPSVAASVELIMFTNGDDANEAPGPEIVTGQTVTWSYRVTNTGAVTLTGLAVTDDQFPAIACPLTSLAPSATMTCTVSGVAALGQHSGLGTVSGNWSIPTNTPPSGTVTDTDFSHYLGVQTLDENEGGKVQLCHVTGNGRWTLASVSRSAEPGHLAHGDGKPGGPVPGQSGKMFGPTCSVQ